jgi:uncharacterized protein (TIGR02466 family)
MIYDIFNIFPTTIYVGNSEKHIQNKKKFYNVYSKYDFEDTTVSENSGNPLLHLDEELQELFDEIVSNTKTYIHEVLLVRDIFNIAVTKSWISRARNKNQEIPWHIHSTSQISFVYYINTPKNSNSLQFLNFNSPNNLFLGMNSEYKKKDRMIIDDYNYHNSNTFYITPQEGHIVLFPSSIRHSTKNINGDFGGERLAIVGDITLLLKQKELSLSMGYLDPQYWKIYE